MAAPTYVASYSPASDWSSTTTPKTTSVTGNANDILVVLGGTESHSITLNTPSDGSLTYTLQQSAGGTSNCWGYAWTAPVVVGALVVTTTSLPNATVGVAYSQTLAASGGTGSGYTWSITTGSLPGWASLNSSTGVISGSTPTAGTASFTVEVTDSASNTATQALSITTGSTQPSGPSGSWNLVWNDEFNNASGMSGHTNGLASSRWNVGFYNGPASPGGAGYTGLSKTASNNAGAIEFYGPKALSFPNTGGMVMSCYAPGAGPDGSGITVGGTSYTAESGMINTAGIMNFTCNTSYSPPSAIAGTIIQAAHIVIEVQCQFPGPDYVAGNNPGAGGYWSWIGSYNCGDCTTSGYPNSGTWTEEMDIWESFMVNGSTGADFYTTFHQASSYGSVVSTPSGDASTDLSLAMHTYTAEYTDSSLTLWVDGTLVSTVSPSSANMAAQFTVPQYLGIAFQLKSGYTATGAVLSGHTATPFTVNYVRVFTQ